MLTINSYSVPKFLLVLYNESHVISYLYYDVTFRNHMEIGRSRETLYFSLRRPLERSKGLT